MKKLTSYINSYFSDLGFVYDTSMNKNNSGWLYSYTDPYLGDYYYSLNSYKAETVEYFLTQLEAITSLDGMTFGKDIQYSDVRFNCYYQKRSDGEYDIFFCYG